MLYSMVQNACPCCILDAGVIPHTSSEGDDVDS